MCRAAAEACFLQQDPADVVSACRERSFDELHRYPVQGPARLTVADIRDRNLTSRGDVVTHLGKHLDT